MIEDLRSKNIGAGEKVQLPGFGAVSIIPAINAEGCVDPRKAALFIILLKELAKAMRYHPNVIRCDNYEGAERSPGASFGKAMSLAAAVPDLSSKRAINIVAEWEESEGRKFSLHEDDQVLGCKLGCSHADRASEAENEPLYGIPSAQVLEMRDYVISQVEAGEMQVAVPMLTKPHREKGVLWVLGEDQTVSATDGTDEFFRFDALRHERSLDRLAYFAQVRGIAVNAENLKLTAQKQRNATLSLLAAGLPIFQIDLRTPSHQVTKMGLVPLSTKKLSHRR